MIRHETLTLLPALESVREGRELVREVVAAGELRDLEDAATLLTSEALTNAVVHAATAVRVDVFTGDQLLVRVSDHDPRTVLTPAAAARLAALLRDPDLTADGGRGLTVVAKVADSWGFEQRPDGKTFWFRLGSSAAIRHSVAVA